MSKQSPFMRIAILGVGLIGGSLGLAFKKRFSNVHVRGLGRDRSRLETAKKLGAIDDLATDLSKGFKDCDLVILATPVEHILQVLESLANDLDPETVVTDVGSTKRMICSRARHQLPSSIEFVGGHPVAGREVTGVENSLPDLFQDAPYILCPLPGARSGNLQKLLLLVEGIGARPAVMAAEDHDQTIAWASHLPQLISTALANVCQGQETPDNKLIRSSGSGFRDMVRLAGSPYQVWQGILETNDDNVDHTLEAFIRQLEKMRSDLKERRLSYDFERAVEFYNAYRSVKQKKS
jgi:prephenate dehydrogenase